MKTTRFCTIFILAFGLCSCSPKVHKHIIKEMHPVGNDTEVTVYGIGDVVPENAEVIGNVSVLDGGFTSHCDWETVLETAKQEVRAVSFNDEPICRLIMERVHEGQFKAQMDCKLYHDYALGKEQVMALREAARFRTSHQRINVFPFYIGGSVFTGDPGMEETKTEIEPRAASGLCYVAGPYGNPDKYRHGVLYLGAGPISFGWDCEGIRHALQNIIGHNWISPTTPWFKYIKYKPRLYAQFGWSELW